MISTIYELLRYRIFNKLLEVRSPGLAWYFLTLVDSEHFALGFELSILPNARDAETAAFALMSTRSTRI
jgi:hypothetical protein